KAKNLYPSLTAPSFNQHGGNITNNFTLSMTAPAGGIYYTIDGSDPRLPGGAVSAAAKVYSAPITLSEHSTIKARAIHSGSWSAMNEADFTIVHDFTELLVSELMYHPPDVLDTVGDEFEFIELK